MRNSLLAPRTEMHIASSVREELKNIWLEAINACTLSIGALFNKKTTIKTLLGITMKRPLNDYTHCTQCAKATQMFSFQRQINSILDRNFKSYLGTRQDKIYHRSVNIKNMIRRLKLNALKTLKIREK